MSKFFLEDCLKDDLKWAYEQGYLSADSYKHVVRIIEEYKELKK
jgi:hypothetical protein